MCTALGAPGWTEDSGTSPAAVATATAADSASSAAAVPADIRHQLSAAYAATCARLDHQSAQWTATITLGHGDVATVRVISTPDRFRYDIDLVDGTFAGGADGGTGAIHDLSVVMTPAGWQVSEGGGPAETWRPFEVPFNLPDAYRYMRLATPEGIDHFAQTTVFDGIDGFTVRFHDDLPAAVKARLTRNMAELEREPVADLSPAALAERNALAERTRDMVVHGIPGRADLQSGIVTAQRRESQDIAISGFRWMDAVDPAAMVLPGADNAAPGNAVRDHGAPLTTIGKPEDWVLFQYGATWSPGSPLDWPHNEQVLVNLVTHDIRRIPFSEYHMADVGFTADHRHVVVMSIGFKHGLQCLVPYLVDLATGARRTLATNDPDDVTYSLPTCSPDGTRIAIQRSIGNAVTDPVQIGCIDPVSGDYSTIGTVFGGEHLSWLPDGKTLLMERVEIVNGSEHWIICTMAPDGSVHDVCTGRFPVSLCDGRICYRDTDARLWKTCAADGGDVRICGDGLPHCIEPARSPDGKRMLFVRFESDGPHVVSVDTGDWSVTRAFSLPGLWTRPVW
jgi:hypothetical protein